MKRNLRLTTLLIVVILAFGSRLHGQAPAGAQVEYIDGQAYLIHTVKPGETLYSIARQYKVSMNAIAKATPEVRKGLYEGMLIKIPYKGKPQTGNRKPTRHVVQKGETLYSIARQYAVQVAQIKAWNNLTTNELEVGQELIIGGDAPDVPTDFVRDGKKIHVVQAGEGLYGIARAYRITVEQLMQWNDLSGISLALGQELVVGLADRQPPAQAEQPDTPQPSGTVHIVQPGEGLYGIARQYGVTVDNLMTWNKLTDTALHPGQRLVVSPPTAIPQQQPPPVVSQPVDWQPAAISYRYSTARKQHESGVAAPIEGTNEEHSYLALHRTLPPGTIIAVRNEMNDQVVFVRVVGKLPDTGLNDHIIIRLSGAAVKQLQAIDQRFRVELVWLKPQE